MIFQSLQDGLATIKDVILMIVEEIITLNLAALENHEYLPTQFSSGLRRHTTSHDCMRAPSVLASMCFIVWQTFFYLLFACRVFMITFSFEFNCVVVSLKDYWYIIPGNLDFLIMVAGIYFVEK